MLLRLCVALTCTLVLALPAAAGIKCWTNSDGVRECGNAIPPEYAQEQYEEVNPQGVTINRVERALTPEEVAAAREAKRLEEIEAREQARIAERDRVLLDTYTSVTDLELARDGQISHIESQIRITEDRIEKLEANLDGKISRAAAIERRGKTPPTNLKREIDALRSQIQESRTFIANKQLERKHVHRQFEQDIERYRELKGLAVADDG